MTREIFPHLKTKRLTLRKISFKDQTDIFILRSDKRVNKYLDRLAPGTIEEAKDFIIKIISEIDNKKSLYWVIESIDTNSFVGTICLFNFSYENSCCEIGYELMTKYQGQGIMREAAEEVIRYAFDALSLQKINAFTHFENLRSIQLLRKLGFVRSKEVCDDNPNLLIFNLTHEKHLSSSNE